LYNYNIVTRLLQNENIFQLLNNLFICVPISWYNDILGCKRPLIEIFIFNFFPNIHHDISKFHKYWNYQTMIVFCLHHNVLSPINERFMPTLKGLWWATSLLFRRNPLASHMPFVPTIHWMILRPFVFTNV